MIALLAYAGLRVGEAVALRRVDIDVPGGFVLVDENLAEANGALVFDTPKSHQKRLLGVGPSLAKRLGRHLETLSGGDDALLFTTPGGKPLRYNQWRKAYFDPAVSAAGLTDVTPRSACLTRNAGRRSLRRHDRRAPARPLERECHDPALRPAGRRS